MVRPNRQGPCEYTPALALLWAAACEYTAANPAAPIEPYDVSSVLCRQVWFNEWKDEDELPNGIKVDVMGLAAELHADL